MKILTLIFLFSFGSDMMENRPLSEPRAISCDLQGNIYIADTGNNRILKCNSDGVFLKSIGGFGWENQQFDMPLDICANSILDVFVADYNNNRIERYDKDLNYISTLVTDESLHEKLQFGYPGGVSISLHGELFVVDAENNRVLKIDSFGNPKTSFGDFSEGAGKLDAPVQIEVGTDEQIYISDKAAGRVVVFDYFGNYVTEIGTGMLTAPTGLYFDQNQRLWIADEELNEVFVFSTAGNLCFRSSNIESEQKMVNHPVDIAVNKTRAYIIDDNVIRVFEIRN